MGSGIAGAGKGGFHFRGFVSFLAVFSFLLLAVTGILLYVIPPGRVAFWVIWKFAGMMREQWTGVHTLSGYMFLITGGFHIYYNWKPLVGYLVNRVSGGIKLKKELSLAALVTIVIVAGAIFNIPPMSLVLSLGSNIKDSYVVDAKYGPPFGHAELLSFNVFCKKMEINADDAAAELQKNGVAIKDRSDSIAEIASANNMSPMEVYKVIKKFEPEITVDPSVVLTPEMVEEKYTGTGIGLKPLEQICSETGVPIQKAMERLQKKGVRVSAGENLKSIGRNNGMEPMDVMITIMVE